jgi:hypothetical protein
VSGLNPAALHRWPIARKASNGSATIQEPLEVGGNMATFAIDAVRIDPHRGKISHVRLGPVDPVTRAWQSQTSVVDVEHVVDIIRRGDDVWSLFTLGGTRFLGPKIRSVPHTDGHDGIDTDVPDGHIEKCIDDLPRL